MRREGVLVQQTADALLLLAPDSGMYYELDGVGARIWELCDGTRDTDAVIQLMCDEFDAPPDVITTDVHALLADLASEHLVEDAA